MSDIPECHEWQKESPEEYAEKRQGLCVPGVSACCMKGHFWSHKMGLKKERKLFFFFFLMEPEYTQSEILNKR